MHRQVIEDVSLFLESLKGRGNPARTDPRSRGLKKVIFGY